MKISATVIATLTVALFFCAPAAAQMDKSKRYLTGMELHQYCSSKYDTDYGFCAGYVTGIADIMLTEPVAGYRACNHASVRAQQLIDIVNNFAPQNKALLRDSGKVLAAAAIARAFPCQ